MTATLPALLSKSKRRSLHESIAADNRQVSRTAARPGGCPAFFFEVSDALDVPSFVMEHLLLTLENLHMRGRRTMFVMLDERMEEGNLDNEPAFFAGQLTA